MADENGYYGVHQHIEETDAAVAPTCTATGLTEGKHCSVCNEVIVAQTEVAALGHSYNSVVTAPTCTADGYTTYTCSACGDSYVDNKVDALGHKYESVVTAPTCTNKGYTTYTCSVCSDTYIADEVDAKGHDTELVDNKDGTHSEKCKNCDYVGEAKEHYFDVNNGHECACGKIGTITVTWLNEDGSELKKIDVTFGTEYTDLAPAAPTKAATAEYTYEFSNWKYETDEATGNVTAKPVFTKTANSYTVKWMDGNMVVEEETLDYGTVITKHASLTKEGYTFDGWADYTTGMTMPAEDVTFTAKWLVNSYTVTWMNGEKVFATTEVNYGEKIEAPATEPEKDKDGCTVYNFSGWSTYSETMPAKDLTVTAQFSTAVQHNWSETAEYIWTIAGENTTCTAKLVCLIDQTHCLETQAVTVEKVTVEASTCTEPGTFHYKATFNVDWATDNEYATNYSLDFAPHTIVKVEEKTATCTEGGNIEHWKCTAENCGKLFADAEGQTETDADKVKIDAKGHTVKAEFTWAEDFTCTVKLTCGECTEVPVESAACEISEQTEEATCVNDGKTTYTASYTYKDKPYTDVAEQVIPATGEHTYVDGVCSGCGDTEVELLEFVKTTSVDLGNSLSLLFIVDPDFDDDNIWELIGTDNYAVISKLENGVWTAKAEVPQSEWGSYSKNRLSIPYDDITAMQMTDKFKVVIYNKNREAVSTEYEDSVRNYAMRGITTLAKDPVNNAKRLTMFVDFLNYGAAAQINFHYNTDDLANSELTAEQQQYATPGATAENKREGDGSTNVNVESRIELGFAFAKTDVNQDMYAIISYTHFNGTAYNKTVMGTEFESYSKGTKWRIPVYDLTMADCNQMITCTVYNADGNQIAQAKDSVNSYMSRVIASSNATAELKALANEVLKLSVSAYAWFTSK